MAIEPRYFAARIVPGGLIYLIRRLVETTDCGWESSLGIAIDVLATRTQHTRQWTPVREGEVDLRLRQHLAALPSTAYVRVSPQEIMGLRLLGQAAGVHTNGRFIDYFD
jgi:hypothetical protein